MLNLLIDYSKNHGLTIEPGFKPKTVRWAIVCDSSGHFLNLQELGRPDEKNNRGRLFNVCPDLTQPEMKAGGPGCRHFLVDNVAVITLMGKDGDIRVDGAITESERKKALAKHDFFVKLLHQSADVLEELKIVASLFNSNESLSEIQLAFSEKRYKPEDSVTFAITGRNPTFLVQDDFWHDWWRVYRHRLIEKKTQKRSNPPTRQGIFLSQAGRMRCFGSGQLTEPALTHPKIEGLSDVGGIAMGDVFSGYKQESFRSFFLKQSMNSAMSEEEAASYRAALNDLVKKHAQLLAGAKGIYWYAGKQLVDKSADPMMLLDNSSELSWLDEFADSEGEELDALHRARLFLQCLRSAEDTRLSGLSDYRYYAIILSANSGRVVVRDWVEGQFGELAESIETWFNDLEIKSVSGAHSAKPAKIEGIITCLLPPMKSGQKRNDWIKPIGNERSQLWRAAIRKAEQIPYKVISRIVPLHQAFMLSGDYNDAHDKESQNRARMLSILYARMSLWKAYHVRKDRQKGETNMKPYLNEEHPDAAYHCGRLMAVLGDMQREALGKVGAGVIQKYYASASATPALVLGRLARQSNYHLEKITYHKKREGLNDIFTGIWCRLRDEIPTVLNLEQQSLFALGFYQQTARIASIDWKEYQPTHSSETEGDES